MQTLAELAQKALCAKRARCAIISTGRSATLVAIALIAQMAFFLKKVAADPVVMLHL